MTEAEPDEQELLAAEYVLGTLDAEERARARALVAMDPGFAAIVRAWERRLDAQRGPTRSGDIEVGDIARGQDAGEQPRPWRLQ